MALKLLRVLVLGVVAAAADDVNVTWSSGRAALPCVVTGRERLRARRPPPPLDADERPRPKVYTWRHDDQEVSSKRVSPNGTLDASRKRDGAGAGGLYQCAVRHQSGLVLGYPVTLKFAAIEAKFSSSPEPAVVMAGQPYALTCRIRSAPHAEVSWLKDGHGLPQNNRYYELTDQLLITDIQIEDAGLYICTATNTVLSKSRSSPEARLQVQGQVSETEAGFLKIDHVGNITAPRGSRVVLACPVVGWPRPKLIWELTPPAERTSELEHTDEILVLTSLEYDQEGVYVCMVEGNSQLVKTFNVTITEPPVITIPPTPKVALRASTNRFNCTAAGRPAPNVTWYKDGQALVMGGRINLRISTDGKRNELVIGGVTSDDAGVYQCFAQNIAGVASAWTTLNVTGADAAAPSNVKCWPEGVRSIRVSWAPPTAVQVVAYTVHTTLEDSQPGTTSLPGQPHPNTEELVTVDQALTPYKFEIRAYMQPTLNNNNVASDMSQPAVCQGQGVPIRLAKVDEDSVIVSWKHFANLTPGVLQWTLQVKYSDDLDASPERNVTLDGSVYNYTLSASDEPMSVRVLGTKQMPWLQQDLSLVPWTPTAAAGEDLDDGDITAVPHDLEVSELTSRGFTVSWRCDDSDSSAERYLFLACARKLDGTDDCKQSNKNAVAFEALLPDSDYEVRVQARVEGRALGGPFSPPFLVTTPPEGLQHFKNLTGQYLNSTTLRISWVGAVSQYTVHYSAQLKLPVEQWASVETSGNTVLITGIDPTETTYVMVMEKDSLLHSKIETIQPLIKDLDAKDLHYEYTSAGVRVWWRGAGPRGVCYAQNITRPVEQWASVNVTQPFVELTGLDPNLPTYVMVTSGKKRPSTVLSIKPRPKTSSNMYYGVGFGVGVGVLCVLAVAAVCIWRRRKRSRSPVRSRRRNVAATEGTEEDGSEMKNIGGRLANGGGSRDAGEPLLNGHVHITENPTSKTPNGKMKIMRLRDAAFDLSRYEDPDTTQETVLNSSTASAAYDLLDTSRRPEYDLSRSSNNSFNKLPDDNMNSELTRSTFELDNSKIQPTLQPNG